MTVLSLDETLERRLPLPLARIYHGVYIGKSAKDRVLTAYYLWEAALKLLASVAVVEYAENSTAQSDEQLNTRLSNLARPAVGHWWEFIRLLVPLLAREGLVGSAS